LKRPELNTNLTLLGLDTEYSQPYTLFLIHVEVEGGTKAHTKILHLFYDIEHTKKFQKPHTVFVSWK